MSTTTIQTSVPTWRYQCPNCGFGDGELGPLHADHVVYCEVCVEDGEHVRLRRWDAVATIAKPEAG